ncbi:MAG: hypothetical protein KF723_22435 [Rhizobiaceae bacterium]|nr:hypothetical protein [Rhizobiaceae bacterium]
MPAFIADFAAWRTRKNRERADAILASAKEEASAANARARWWNRARIWACGLGPWPGLPIGKGAVHG